MFSIGSIRLILYELRYLKLGDRQRMIIVNLLIIHEYSAEVDISRTKIVGMLASINYNLLSELSKLNKQTDINKDRRSLKLFRNLKTKVVTLNLI